MQTNSAQNIPTPYHREERTLYFGIIVPLSQWTHFLYVYEMCHTNSKFESTGNDVDQDLTLNCRSLQEL